MSKQRFGVELPSTLQRSPDKAQRTYAKTLRSAEGEYGRGERARRTAMASLKHGFEKVGDHWEPKDHKGPSDPQDAAGGRQAREHPKETFGGVDVLGHSKAELYARAKELQIAGRSTMSKEALARAIARKQR
ncbi:ChaB family protein [Azohydromonas lata]|uniref:ChaB family protein n=1 Tax=Azohydromonas lata TaxID=45677 RepID=UPI0008335496|nr:ChaB family protein [Azohydromonas lata]